VYTSDTQVIRQTIKAREARQVARRAAARRSAARRGATGRGAARLSAARQGACNTGYVGPLRSLKRLQAATIANGNGPCPS
jgi:hypothetical protein